MATKAKREMEVYAPVTVEFSLETAAAEQAYRDFLGALSSPMIEAVLQAHDTDTATRERVMLVWQQFQEQLQAMAPLGEPPEAHLKAGEEAEVQLDKSAGAEA